MTMRKTDVEQVRDAFNMWVLAPDRNGHERSIPIRAICDLALKSFDEPTRGCAHPRLYKRAEYSTGTCREWTECIDCHETQPGDLVRERFIRGIPNGGGR